MPLQNRELFKSVQTAQFKILAAQQTLILTGHGILIENATDAQSKAVETFLEKFIKNAAKKWKEADRSLVRLDRKYAKWLSEEVVIPELKAPVKPKDGNKGGRPPKEFSLLGKRSRDRSTAPLREQNTGEKLLHAAKINLKAEGKAGLVKVIDEADRSPTRSAKLIRLSGIADKLDKVPKKDLSLPTKVSEAEAVAYILGFNVKKEAYMKMRLISLAKNSDIWPVWDKILDRKVKRRPKKIDYGEMAVKLELRERLKRNDTAFIELCNTEIGQLLRDVEPGGTLKLTCEGKLGFDGSTGQSLFQQKFSPENRDKSDESLLATCYVPLQYRVEDGEPIFTNPVPQSASFCQPLRLEFIKETKDSSCEIDRYIM